MNPSENILLFDLILYEEQSNTFWASTLSLRIYGFTIICLSVCVFYARNFSFKPCIRFLWLFCTYPWLLYFKNWRIFLGNSNTCTKGTQNFLWAKIVLIFLKTNEDERLYCYLFSITNPISGKILVLDLWPNLKLCWFLGGASTSTCHFFHTSVKRLCWFLGGVPTSICKLYIIWS